MLWSALHLFAFLARSILYLVGAAFVLFGVRDVPRTSRRGNRPFDARRYPKLIADRRLALFLPAWISANARAASYSICRLLP